MYILCRSMNDKIHFNSFVLYTYIKHTHISIQLFQFVICLEEEVENCSYITSIIKTTLSFDSQYFVVSSKYFFLLFTQFRVFEDARLIRYDKKKRYKI